MDKYLAIAAFAGALGLAGCAIPETRATTSTAKDGGEYVTGSRVPRKSDISSQPVKQIDKEAWRQEHVISNAPRGN